MTSVTDRVADDHAALQILVDLLDERLRDVEADNEALRATLHACLDGLRFVTRERDDLRAQIDFWIRERRASIPPIGGISHRPDKMSGRQSTRRKRAAA